MAAVFNHSEAYKTGFNSFISLSKEEKKDLITEMTFQSEDISPKEIVDIISRKMLIDNNRLLRNITISNYTIELSEQRIELPYQLEKLYDAIDKSRYLIGYKEIDEDTGIETLYEKTTWERSIKFLAQLGKWAFEKHDLVIDAPKIYDGPNGSIDMYWKSDSYRLMINFPTNENTAPSYYGDDYADLRFEASIDLKKNLLFTFSSIVNIICIAHELDC